MSSLHIAIAVQGQNLPDRTLVRLRVTTSGSVLSPASAALTNNTATFTLRVSKGHGTIQAFADLTLTSA